MIHGRDRSLLEETPEESTVPSSRGSLLRDVVGVAVDADAPGTFAMGPQDHEKRSLQSQWIIIGGAIVVMVALVFALTSITRDIGGLLDDPLATATPPSSTAPTQEDTGEAPVEPTEEATEEPELPAPEFSGVELFAPGSDREPDNADQQERMTDGDPSTYWSSKRCPAGPGWAATTSSSVSVRGTLDVHRSHHHHRPEQRWHDRAARAGGRRIARRGGAGPSGDGEVRLTAPEPLETRAGRPVDLRAPSRQQ